MRPLSTSELLGVWERGLEEYPAERAHALLAAACPEMQPEELRQLGAGQRDAYLVTLREWTFGPQATGLATCPECGENHEVDLPLANLKQTHSGEQPEAMAATVGEFELRFRPPTSMDLSAIARQGDVGQARLELFGRCLLSAQRGGVEVEAEEIPEEIIGVVAEKLEEADPQSDVEINLMCSRCERKWEEPFDIVSFFWSEVHVWACRMLMEVHALASAYGWREADILAMHPWRRQCYLEMTGNG
jgi:hypothetical protein